MHSLSPIKIVKASGQEQQYDEAKLIKSLSSTGMSIDLASQALDYVKRHLKPGITTTDIHGVIAEYLRDNAPLKDYYNYGLKRAIMALGPSGHPFETLVADVLNLYGFKTEVSVIVLGKCVTHEIDIVAIKDNKQYFIECKYHNTPGTKTDIQVALYTYARYQDVKSAMLSAHPENNVEYNTWLITNTKVTTEVIYYAGCVGMATTSWLLPKGVGLHEMILNSGLHPVTVMDNVIPQEKIQALLNRGIVTCARLKKAIDTDSINDILSKNEISNSLISMNQICKNG